MADEKTYVIRLASWLGRAIGESGPLFANFHTATLGIDLPNSVLQAPAVANALRPAEVAATKVRDTATALGTAAAAGDDFEILGAFVRMGAALAEFYDALDALVSAVDANVTPATIPDPAARADAEAFVGLLVKKISDYALASAITEHLPELGFILRIAGLLDWVNVPRDGNPLSRGHVRRGLRLDRIRTLISDPAEHFRQTIGWGNPGFDPTPFFNLAADFFPEESTIEVGVEAGEPFLKACLLLKRDSTLNPPGLTVTMFAETDADREVRAKVTDEWDVGVSSNLRMVGGISGSLTPPLGFELRPLSGQITGESRAFFDRNAAARPFEIVGGNGLLTIAATNLSAGLGMKAEWNGTTATFDPLIFANLDGLTLRLGTGDADSFIGSLLSNADIAGEFDLGLEWRASTGLRVTASGGIEIALPIHKQLGPIEFDTVYFALRIQQNGTLATELSAALNGKLGPLAASVDRIGVAVDIRFAEETEADFGPFDLDLRFKPPNGIGLSIDAGMVKGGGYLFIDVDRGEYAGALELTFSGFLSLKAIGVINTRMPDGTTGFSLLIIITAEFGTGIQLGFGFTLLGVGGLIGLNRTMRLEPLLEGVRTGSIDGIMFPRDVVANAPRIINDIRRFFPPEEGTFLIGPMAKLGWGTPTLVSVSLGIIIEIPGNIAILGVLRVALPTEEAAILKLQVNFVGAIEFDKKRIFFFAALFDSRVVFLTIEGEMGLLVAFGDDANFVISVGGFHPSFSPPPLPFPSPVRVSVSLINTSAARVRIEGYFAVTSNTAQFGARAEMFFGFNSLNVQGHLAFDALFQFSPFYFIITISASFSVKVFGIGMFSVRLRGELSGPTPWRAHGTASISLFFFDIDVDVDVTWGESRNTELPPISVMPIFAAELDKRENWRALPPVGNNLLVSLRKLPETDTLVLHPVGTLKISQRALPLELKLDKVGNQKPSDVNRLSISVTAPGLAKKGDTFEQFAPAQFQDFDDAGRLSRPAYAPERAGLEITAAGADVRSSRMVRRIARYEEIIIDSNKRIVLRFAGFLGSLFTFFLGGASVTKVEISKAQKTKLDPFVEKVEVREETYTVAFQSNNQAFSAAALTFHSEASARDFLQRETARDPNLAESLHVIPSYERAA